MSEERQAKQITETELPATNRTGTGRGLRLGAFASIFALAAIVLSLIAFLEGRRVFESSAARHADVARLADRVEAMERDLDGLRSTAAEADESLAALSRKQSAAAEAIAGLLEASRQTNLDWALAEIEYLLIIATHRLALAKDVPTALAATEAAARRLENLAHPGLEEVRYQLAADMDALKAVHDVDITGLALYLTDLAARAESLPLGRVAVDVKRNEGRPGQGAASAQRGWRGLFDSIWRELKGLVVISRTGIGAGVTLLPEEHYFLIQNLQLQLEIARLAVLRRDTRMLRASLSAISDWLRKYFDREDSGVTNVLDSLDQMGKLELDPELPDINSSLETLRAFIRGNAAEGLPQDSMNPQP